MGTETPDSSRLEVLKRFSENNFDLSDAKDNTSRSLNRGAIADLTLEVSQKPREPSIWEVIDTFVLWAYASVVA